MSKHIRDDGGEYHSISNEVYMVSKGEFAGKMVRILLDNEDNFGDYYSKSVMVCFAGSRHMESFQIPMADLKLI